MRQKLEPRGAGAGGGGEDEDEAEVVDGDEKEGEDKAKAPGGEAANGDNEVADGDGAVSAGALGSADDGKPKFKKGDIVLGTATKHKDAFDQQQCGIFAVLVRHHKVKMLTGPARGVSDEVQKYLHPSAKAIPVEEPPIDETDTDQTRPSDPEAGCAPGGEDSLMQDMQGLF